MGRYLLCNLPKYAGPGEGSRFGVRPCNTLPGPPEGRLVGRSGSAGMSCSGARAHGAVRIDAWGLGEGTPPLCEEYGQTAPPTKSPQCSSSALSLVHLQTHTLSFSQLLPALSSWSPLVRLGVLSRAGWAFCECCCGALHLVLHWRGSCPPARLPLRTPNNRRRLYCSVKWGPEGCVASRRCHVTEDPEALPLRRRLWAVALFPSCHTAPQTVVSSAGQSGLPCYLPGYSACGCGGAGLW